MKKIKVFARIRKVNLEMIERVFDKMRFSTDVIYCEQKEIKINKDER